MKIPPSSDFLANLIFREGGIRYDSYRMMWFKNSHMEILSGNMALAAVLEPPPLAENLLTASFTIFPHCLSPMPSDTKNKVKLGLCSKTSKRFILPEKYFDILFKASMGISL